MTSLTAQLLLVTFLVLVNAGFAGTEMAMVSLREPQLHRLERGSAGGARLARLARDPNRYLSTIQIGITLAGFLASASAAVTLARPLQDALAPLGPWADGVAVVTVTVVLAYVTLVIGELAPKRIALRHAERWAVIASGPLTFFSVVTRPAAWFLGVSTDMVVRLFGVPPGATHEDVSPEDLQTMVESQESMSEQQRRVIGGAFEIAGRRLRDVLQPRTQVFVLDEAADAASALDALVASGHTRAPVAEDGELDKVSGVVHMRDLIGGGRRRIGELATEPVLFPETARVLPVLSELQRRHVQLAVVIDEHGAAAGLVSVEDLVEEIVGEIYDETDKDILEVVTEPDGALLVPGEFPVHDLVDLDVEGVPTSGAYTTVAGLVLDRLGQIPRSPGESVAVSGHVFEVVEMGERAIEMVRIRPHARRSPRTG